AGKSSLLNALAKSDIAIVTDEAGTTRDVRQVPLDLGGQLYILLDLAGIRDTDSKAEAEGVRRARMAIADADIVIWLSAPDISDDLEPPDNALRVGTKADLGIVPGVDLSISSQTGQGMDELLARIIAQGDGLMQGEPS